MGGGVPGLLRRRVRRGRRGPQPGAPAERDADRVAARLAAPGGRGRAARPPPALVSLLAEANFAYLDALASAAAHGYARAREKAAGEREQRRGRLLALLLSDPPAPPEVVREQSARAGWPLPRRLAAIVLRPRPGSGGEGRPGCRRPC
ncbi:hypothetical protein LUX57_47865 [Actinomadura madurae]|uniref:hypothetical protein n=1 Tax=Actinomadura madurae TaxID=1993 RepID=UPI0020D2371D|nr:hypothetical protein [Actinomadura madurae]MCP9971852.1 hypothetical protein [Actinomadura madurae]